MIANAAQAVADNLLVAGSNPTVVDATGGITTHAEAKLIE